MQAPPSDSQGQREASVSSLSMVSEAVESVEGLVSKCSGGCSPFDEISCSSGPDDFMQDFGTETAHDLTVHPYTPLITYVYITYICIYTKKYVAIFYVFALQGCTCFLFLQLWPK